MDNPVKRDSPLKTTLITSALGAATFVFTASPNGHWSAAWGNFIGAALVAASGVTGVLHNLEVNKKWTSPLTWTFLVVGGCAIAGASLQAALAPVR